MSMNQEPAAMCARESGTRGFADPNNYPEGDAREFITKVRRPDARTSFSINVTSNVAYVALTSVAMLAYIPFLVGQIGVAAYGIVALAQMLVMFGLTIADGLASSINRALALALHGKESNPNATFNSALFATLLIAAAMTPLAIAIAWWFPTLFHVPPELAVQSQVLFALSAAHLMLMVAEVAFAAPTIIFHRFDLRNLLRGAVMLIRMGTVVLLFTVLTPNLWHVGLGFLASGVVSIAGYWWCWRKLTPSLRVSWKSVDRAQSSALVDLGAWFILNRVGVVLFMSADLIVINWCFGPTVTGHYAVLILFPELIRNLMDTLTSVLSPAILAQYAKGQFSDLATLTERATRVFAYGLSIPIGLLCGLASPILSLWLGPDFAHLSPLLAIMVGPLVVNLATMPLNYVLSSYAKIRAQAAITIALSALTILLGFAIATWTDFGAIGVVGVGVATLTLRNVVFMSVFSARITGRPLWNLYASLAGGAAATSAIATSAYIASTLWREHGLLQIGLICAVISLIAAPLIYFLCFNRGDRIFLRRLTPFGVRQRMTRAAKRIALSPIGAAT